MVDGLGYLVTTVPGVPPPLADAPALPPVQGAQREVGAFAEQCSRGATGGWVWAGGGRRAGNSVEGGERTAKSSLNSSPLPSNR
ncbi:hypothetical protein GCM10011583_55550 [Streptomyces camponoticapitis]|uniref:Uncharacterized protein n=1 Tax=Streptomyces camponoticapitis TaxID=1616125 RepID=A0ABQ2EM84_9ACTN|nr:hypothetical protein GCM10011583_55550 [Streptomyces camponoticapitis]